ncbi:MAG: glycerophosphodiester phosphodiesterase [Verrucomicrobiota bacterium]|nr:glycerophosphodiester phosphodiesterase [Verrucomicrobiota bacterium]
MKPFLISFHVVFLLSLEAWGDSPIVIAHRGASAYLPEHTLEAKALAHAMGAAFLEQDLVLSRDSIPVVLHDIHIETVTDVAMRFPKRKREDGRFYALDFSVDELKQLNVTERVHAKTGRPVYPGRFPVGKSSFRIHTLEEELEFIAGLNQSTGRTVGIYPEIKGPSWHRRQGYDISRVVLPILQRHGYHSQSDPCWLQCFEYGEVKRIREELAWRGRLTMLLGSGKQGSDGTDFAFLRTPAGLDQLAHTVDGIGPSISSIIEGGSVTGRRVTSLVQDAHARQLRVHPYTVRGDALPVTVVSLADLHRLLFVEAGVDGVFTDFPDKTVQFLHGNGH